MHVNVCLLLSCVNLNEMCSVFVLLTEVDVAHYLALVLRRQ